MNSPYSTGTPLWPKAHTTFQLAALTGAVLHKIQVKSSEGLTPGYAQGLSGETVPLFLLSCPPAQGGNWGREYTQEEQASFRPKLERTKWLHWGGGNYPAATPSCHLHTVHVLRGGTVGPGIFSEGPLTCLWQLWKDPRVEKVEGPPPSQAVQVLALEVEAVVGQPGLCQSPS